jgi:hypothetical protein
LFLSISRGSLPESWIAAFPALLVVCGVAMVSSVMLPKLKPRASKALNVFQYGNAAAAYVLAPLQILPEVLLGQSLLYLTVGVGWCLVSPPKPDASPERKKFQRWRLSSVRRPPGKLFENTGRPVLSPRQTSLRIWRIFTISRRRSC